MLDIMLGLLATLLIIFIAVSIPCVIMVAIEFYSEIKMSKKIIKELEEYNKKYSGGE